MTMTDKAQQLARKIATIADNKKGNQIVILNMQGLSFLTDYFVIVSASNKPLHSSRDLRGGSIAINDRSALLAIIGSQVLAAEGLQEGRDYHFINTVSHSSALQNAVSVATRSANGRRAAASARKVLRSSDLGAGVSK